MYIIININCAKLQSKITCISVHNHALHWLTWLIKSHHTPNTPTENGENQSWGTTGYFKDGNDTRINVQETTKSGKLTISAFQLAAMERFCPDVVCSLVERLCLCSHFEHALLRLAFERSGVLLRLARSYSSLCHSIESLLKLRLPMTSDQLLIPPTRCHDCGSCPIHAPFSWPHANLLLLVLTWKELSSIFSLFCPTRSAASSWPGTNVS